MATKTTTQPETPAELTDLEQLLAEVTDAENRISYWETEAQTRQAHLAEVEATGVVDALADPETADATADRMAVARASADLSNNTLAAARTALVEAQRAVFRGRAAEMRAEAQAKRDEAAVRQAKTNALLAELEEWEDGAVYLAYHYRLVSTWTLGRPWKMPLTQRIEGEAVNLDHQAAVWDDRADRGDLGNFPGWVRLAAAESAPPVLEEAEAAEEPVTGAVATAA